MFEFAKIHVSWSRDAATRSCGAQDGDFRRGHHLSLLQPKNEEVIYAVLLNFLLQNVEHSMFIGYCISVGKYHQIKFYKTENYNIFGCRIISYKL